MRDASGQTPARVELYMSNAPTGVARQRRPEGRLERPTNVRPTATLTWGTPRSPQRTVAPEWENAHDEKPLFPNKKTPEKKMIIVAGSQ